MALWAKHKCLLAVFYRPVQIVKLSGVVEPSAQSDGKTDERRGVAWMFYRAKCESLLMVLYSHVQIEEVLRVLEPCLQSVGEIYDI
jgi:hypothetical protein